MTPLHIYSGVHCAMCKYRSLWLGAYLLYGMTCGGWVSTPVFGKMSRVLMGHTCEIEGPSPLPLPLHLSIQHSDCYFHMNEHAFLAVSLNTQFFNANLFKIYKISLINIFIWSKHHEPEVRIKNYSFSGQIRTIFLSTKVANFTNNNVFVGLRSNVIVHCVFIRIKAQKQKSRISILNFHRIFCTETIPLKPICHRLIIFKIKTYRGPKQQMFLRIISRNLFLVARCHYSHFVVLSHAEVIVTIKTGKKYRINYMIAAHMRGLPQTGIYPFVSFICPSHNQKQKYYKRTSTNNVNRKYNQEKCF